jgi:hypothetical protein
MYSHPIDHSIIDPAEAELSGKLVGRRSGCSDEFLHALDADTGHRYRDAQSGHDDTMRVADRRTEAPNVGKRLTAIDGESLRANLSQLGAKRFRIGDGARGEGDQRPFGQKALEFVLW